MQILESLKFEARTSSIESIADSEPDQPKGLSGMAGTGTHLVCQFYQSIIDSITEHLVVIDQHGDMQYVNKAWRDFGKNNGHPDHAPWLPMNYLAICDAAGASGERYGQEAADGIRQIVSGKTGFFYLEYPCHSNTENRWFMMRICPLAFAGKQFFVISHQNITERKLAEIEALNLARIDGLTGTANRRYFDEFLLAEWKRCERLQLPLSLIMLDIDHFKLFNDTYGHLAGDQCLRELGRLLLQFGNRPGDLSARYGGEEFAMVLGNTKPNDAFVIARNLLERIRNRALPFASSPDNPFLSVSMGVATIYPKKGLEAETLVAIADTSLYSAKNNGRNRIVSSVSCAG
jgi:diguanylate cyclase (GGDEF)-like protein